MNAQFVAKWVV